MVNVRPQISSPGRWNSVIPSSSSSSLSLGVLVPLGVPDLDGSIMGRMRGDGDGDGDNDADADLAIID